MQLSLIVRGQHPPGDISGHLRDDLALVRRADELGFDGIVKGSHYSAHPFQSVQQIPFLAYAAAIAPRLRLICGLVLLPLHKPLDLAEQLATLDIMSGGKLVFGEDPAEIVRGAAVVYTDAWTSMGQEAEAEARRDAFVRYRVDDALLEAAGPDAVAMHCLPAHRGEEITSAVMDGPRSIIWDQSENRLHVQKALLVEVLAE